MEKIKLCKCGCGQPVKRNKKTGEWNRFISGGHNLCMLSRSEEFRKRLSEIKSGSGNPRWVPREIRICECGCGEKFECRVNSKQRFIRDHYSKTTGQGRQHSEETRCKISEARKGKCVGEENSFYGKHHSEESKRKISEALKGKLAGEKHPNWKGGIGRLPYPYKFMKMRDYIRKRDNYECQICGKSEEEDKKESGKYLSVHHVDYNKENCDEKNLIAVCNRHNSLMNFNREIWTVHLQEVQERRYKWLGVY